MRSPCYLESSDPWSTRFSECERLMHDRIRKARFVKTGAWTRLVGSNEIWRTNEEGPLGLWRLSRRSGAVDRGRSGLEKEGRKEGNDVTKWSPGVVLSFHTEKTRHERQSGATLSHTSLPLRCRNQGDLLQDSPPVSPPALLRYDSFNATLLPILIRSRVKVDSHKDPTHIVFPFRRPRMGHVSRRQ